MRINVIGLVLIFISFYDASSAGISHLNIELHKQSHTIYNKNTNCSLPPVCDCVTIDERLTANCTEKGLNSTTIPKFSDDVKTIILDSNQINEMPNNTDRWSRNLHSLYLRRNKMSAINSEAFRGLCNLVVLDLSENLLTTKSNILKNGVFKDMKKLQVLHLHSNSIKLQKPVMYPDKACADLISLTNLSIDGQINASFGSGFSKLENLAHLDFAGFSTVCKIKFLQKTTFQHLSHLETIDASYCHIKDAELGTFASLPNLKHLCLSHNEMLGFKVLSNLTRDLVHTSIEVLELVKIHRTFGLGTVIYKNDIMSVANTSLQVLKLDSNRLELFESEAIIWLINSSLREVSMVDNKLTLGFYVYQVQHIMFLEILNMSYQFKSHHMEEIAGEPDECRTNTDDTRYISSTQRTNYSPLANFDWSPCAPLPPKLKVLDFSSSSFNYRVDGLNVCNNSIQRLIAANNVLYAWIRLSEGFKSVEYIDLSNNFCTEVSDVFFDRFPNLATLLVKQNLLGFSLRIDEKGNIFKSLKKLTTLDISNNRIDTLPNAIFRGLLNLEYLDISNNSINILSFKINHMHKLRFVDLSFNQLRTIPTNITTFIDEQIHHNISVNIQGNPLKCDCNTIEFVEWFQKTKSQFISPDNYYCENKFNKKEKLMKVNLAELKKQCTNYLSLIISTLVGIFAVVFFVIAGLVYRFRWKLRYLYYMAKNRYKGYTPVQHEAEDDYIYDAFIAYSDIQRKFVTKDMVQHLETDAGLSLCIHDRDFLPGNEIGANITDAIHKSRKTVAVVSRDFLKSYWCMFELNMARMESIYSRDGCNNIILILYENDIPQHLPLEFYDLIESNSYIEYPDDPQGNVVFWNNLRESLVQCR